MKTIIKKVIGWALLANLLPIISLVIWRFDPKSHAECSWYIAYACGCVGDAAILIAGLLFVVIAFLITED